MHIIIDGYNLIRQSDSLRRYERQSLEAGRRALIINLAEYKRKKGHQITVVFDGWEGGSIREERDRQNNINIIYSRRGEKADDVVKRLSDNSQEETIIVTSDREIVSYVTRRSKTALSSPEFEMIMMRATAEPAGDVFSEKNDREEETDRASGKKGPARRLPKAKRHLQAKITKL
jgi:predicted RNA-binding protein with PIN domain